MTETMNGGHMSVSTHGLPEFDFIKFASSYGSSQELFHALAQIADDKFNISDASNFAEDLTSTHIERGFGIGDGVAIVNMETESISESFMGFIKLEKPLMMRAPDETPCHNIGVLISSTSSGKSHLQTMARLSRLLKDKTISQKLAEATTENELKDILEKHSAECSEFARPEAA